LEYWSVGKNESPNLACIVFFITPSLHHAITPADCRKGERLWKPPQGAVQSRACRAVALAKAGPLGPDFLLAGGYRLSFLPKFGAEIKHCKSELRDVIHSFTSFSHTYSSAQVRILARYMSSLTTVI
jgi:hypothetical protein